MPVNSHLKEDNVYLIWDAWPTGTKFDYETYNSEIMEIS